MFLILFILVLRHHRTRQNIGYICGSGMKWENMPNHTSNPLAGLEGFHQWVEYLRSSPQTFIEAFRLYTVTTKTYQET